MAMVNSSETQRHVARPATLGKAQHLWVSFLITQLLDITMRKHQADPRGRHAMKQLTRPLKSVMKDKGSGRSEADSGDKTTKCTVESWIGT